MHREIRDVVDWCTKIPLDTPLARLVTADPTLGVIEHDLSASAACEAEAASFL